jgi:polyisoprenoid-binding protein YceI
MTRTRRILAAWACSLIVATWAIAAPETFKFDKVHSFVGFRIRHIVTKVEGRFRDYDGTIVLDRANPAASRVELTIQTASIDTGNDTRDKDLRSPNYFDVEKYPTIVFRSTKVEPKGADVYDVTGDFTMHGVTKTIHVPAKHTGFGKMGNVEKAGFEVSLALKRSDYGMNTGAPVVGDDVEINILVEGNKEGPAAAAPAKS